MNEINSKLRLVLWGKNLQLPMDYDNLEFDRYELKYNVLRIYKNNEMIKQIIYLKNRKIWYVFNYKNGEQII